MAFIEVSDFAGKWKVPQDQFTTVKVQKYIDLYYRPYFVRLLGVALAEIMITDIGLNRAPTDPDLAALAASFQIQSDCGEIYESIGLRETLLGFIYFEYMKDEKVQVSISSGSAKSAQEMATSGLIPEAQIYGRYNESVVSAKAIQWYAQENNTLYPTYMGRSFIYNYSL